MCWSLHFAHRLQSFAVYGHSLLIVIIIALLLAHKCLVAVTGEIGRALGHVEMWLGSGGSGGGGHCGSMGSMGFQFCLPRCGCLLGFLLVGICWFRWRMRMVCVCVMWIVCDQIEIGEICIIIIHEIRMDIKGWIYTQNAGALCDMRGDFSLCMRYLWFPLWRSIYHYECTNTCNSKYSYVNAGTAIIPHTKPREERKRNLPIPIRAGENGSFHSNYAWAAPRISC